MKKAFTLAEVLITLAIIGVVAVLTIPPLVQNHKKKVVALRLKHFYVTLQQGQRLSQIENGTEFEPLEAMTPENTVEFYKKYYMPYIKTVSVEPSTCGAVVSFPNGSGMYMYGRPNFQSPWASGLRDSIPAYLFFCPNYNDCKAINNINCNLGAEYQVSDGVKIFSFYTGGTTPQYDIENATRDQILERCKNQRGYCSSLIERDGWTIKDDYPFKF